MPQRVHSVSQFGRRGKILNSDDSGIAEMARRWEQHWELARMGGSGTAPADDLVLALATFISHEARMRGCADHRLLLEDVVASAQQAGTHSPLALRRAVDRLFQFSRAERPWDRLIRALAGISPFQWAVLALCAVALLGSVWMFRYAGAGNVRGSALILDRWTGAIEPWPNQ